MTDATLFVCAGSLGPVGICAGGGEDTRLEAQTDDAFDPCDAEALGDHVIAQMNQARAGTVN